MKIAMLVSGGVDSSVALATLKDQGHDVTAFYLKIWLEDELSSLGSCPWEEDLSYVRDICTQLDVPLQILSLQQAYWDIVVADTIKKIKSGHTPNPDILCNQFVKFGAFFELIDTSFDRVATGHYAQLNQTKHSVLIARSPDPVKDQSYFLCRLSEQQIRRALFPIGHLHKHEVRALARTYNLPTKDRKDSQGICFLGKFKFRDFVAHHLGMQQGAFINAHNGSPMGNHNGHWFYTVGQRQDIRLSGGPWYVTSKNPMQNIVYIANNYQEFEQSRREFFVNNLVWHQKPNASDHILVKMRHRAQPQLCSINQVNEEFAHVQLSTIDQGIAPGQYAVFYDEKNQMLGSGIITSNLLNNTSLLG